MKKLLTIISLCFAALVATAQTFNPTAIPLGTDFIRPGAGGHLWNNRDAPFGTIHIPVSLSPQESNDYYFRFSMTHFFTGSGSDSTINWSFFRARFVEAINKRQGIRFRVMTLCNNCDPGFNNLVSYAGGQTAYPQFLHNLMQAESNPQHRDWFSTQGDQDTWVMNWNSPQAHRWIRKLSQQIRNYIDTASHNGFNFRDAFRIYDLGYYGAYSEQHSNTVVVSNISEYPAGSGPTEAGLIAIADAQMDAFTGSTKQFVVPFNAFDAEWLGHTRNPPGYGRWLLDHPDSISWINDHIGAVEGYDDDYIDFNGRMGGNYQSRLNNRWRYGPTGGEPVGWGSPADRSGITQYVNTYHMSWFGNGNLDHINNSFTTEANNIRTAARLAGYRLRLTGGNVNVAASINISANWLNEGNAPNYENWTVQYLIKNGSGTTVSTLTSGFTVRLFQPSGTPTTRNDNYAIPAIPAGTYGLYVRIVDPTGYRLPMPLAITGQQGDGSYFLANINIPTGGSNQPPVADAGANQSITISTATLNGTGSTDPDGTIASYAWTQLSGPNTAGITSPSSATTGLTGLVGGSYVFNLLVTDNNGATSGDNVTITVNTNTPPVANAGPNQAITLPTSSVTMAGSGTDNIGISSYLWTKVGGPNTFVITTPSSATSTITGLTTAGVYTFRLTVTDGSGLTNTDDMTVTVNAGNTAPIANAGANQTITLPTSTASLSGSLSTDNVGITAYLWTQVGGPITATIATPTTVGTNISGMTTAGFYIFRLRVEDVAGLSHTDDVQITVNATANTAPVANAGPNQTVTLPTNFVQLNGTGSTDNIGIVTYLWTKQDGPGTFSLGSPNNAICNAESLQTGVYTFRLTVTDGSGLSSFDDVIITVQALPNTAPIAVAGANQSITLPTSSTTVNGNGSSDNVAVTSYAWSQVSGPVTAVIATSGNVSTGISGMTTVGTYVFRLTVLDVAGLSDTDDLTITVNAAANNAPIAAAGINQTITLPTNSVSLSGSGSTDDVAVTAYLWTQISGPSVATISAATSVNTNMNNLIEGDYFFLLTVTDAGGLTDTDDVRIRVAAAPVTRPTLGGKVLIRTNRKFLPRAF